MPYGPWETIMIKMLTLFVIVWNPVTDTESTIVYGQYEYNECLIKEFEINKEDSILNIQLTESNLELNATLCD